MKAIVYCLFATLSFFVLVSHAQVPSKNKPIISKTVPITSFDSLDIQGPINVYIDATQSHPSLQILGDQKRVLAVIYNQKNHTLHLGTKPIYRSEPGERLTIRINTSSAQIKQIQFNKSWFEIFKYYRIEYVAVFFIVLFTSYSPANCRF